jgi:catechol 2,3-dioxygenase-like lactoylglutathione lyase family enzyme
MARAHLGLDEGSSVRELGGAGIRYVSFQARRGTVERIGRFYAEMLGATVHVEEHAEGEMAITAAVLVGPSVHFVFFEHREEDLSAEEEAKQAGKGAASDGGEGLHACVYIHSFKRAFERLDARGLIWTNPRFRHLDTCDSWEEAHASRQFRFKSIVDLDTMEPLLELEHEVRAQRHFQFYKRTHYPPGSGL